MTAEIAHAALAEADRTFQRYYRPPVPLCMYCDFSPKGLAESLEMQRFFAIVRDYRNRRLEMPIATIWDTSLGHTRGIFHNDIRRLAWFVPPILAAMLDPDLRAAALAALAAAGKETTEIGSFESRPSDPPWFTSAELTALDDFLAALLSHTTASPRESAHVLAISHHFRSSERRLADTWAGLAPLSLAQTVLESWGDPPGLLTEHVRAALETAALTSTDAHVAQCCSDAEQLLRSRLR